MTAEPPPATFTTYEALIATMRARRIALGLSQLAVDELAGLPSGYVGKVEASLTNPTAKNARSIGRESLPLMLGALRLEMTVLTRAKHAKLHKPQNALSGGVAQKNMMAERGRKGGIRSSARMTAEQLRRRAKKAAQARWAKHRKEKAATKRSRCAVPPSDT